jgi:ubiquinone biosynthesis protein
MEKFTGEKITEVTQNPVHRRRCARALFRSMICHPLFSRNPKTLFHGDPHAGNIFGFFDHAKKKIRIALLDWSQAGELFQKQREEIHRLFLAIASGDRKKIHGCIENLSQDEVPDVGRIAKRRFLKQRRSMLHEIYHAPQFTSGNLMEKAFFLIDQSALRGIRYPKNLLLFRKAFFTLQGVIYDLDPHFDMDRYMIQILSELFVEDLPTRCWYFFFPYFDKPSNYRLAVSNVDLEALFIRMLLKSGSTLVSFFYPPKWSYG